MLAHNIHAILKGGKSWKIRHKNILNMHNPVESILASINCICEKQVNKPETSFRQQSVNSSSQMNGRSC